MNTLLQKQLKILRNGDCPDEKAGIFGYDFPIEDSKLVILPVPWEPTASYGKGTKDCPQNIVPVSHQLDLFDVFYGDIFESGIHLGNTISKVILDLNTKANSLLDKPDSLNSISKELNQLIKQKAKKHLKSGQKVAVLGGDHSSPFGLVSAIAEELNETFGILHIDAHHDLRESYQGYSDSHASIMRNILDKIPSVSKLVSVGIRDFSKNEYEFVRDNQHRIRSFYWEDLYSQLAGGESFDKLSKQILEDLPDKVYISFDIDGLSQAYCPGTGTPVPGGLSFDQATYIIKALSSSGKEVIGFDLCEVASSSSDWDLNVAARILYKLCGAAFYK